MIVIPLRVCDDEMEMLKESAELENVSVSDLLRNTTLEKLGNYRMLCVIDDDKLIVHALTKDIESRFAKRNEALFI